MTKSLLVFLAIVSLQGEPPKTTGSKIVLTGKWVSTTVPGPGEAPAIAPSFTIEEKDNKFIVTIQDDKTPYVATSFAKSRTESILVLKSAATSAGTRTFIIRPEGTDRIRFEVFNEYPQGSRRANYYYAEVFKKAS